MAGRSEFGSNEPAGPGKRRLRYWADKHDGRGYRRCSETIKGSRRDGRERLAQLQLLHGADKPVPTVRECYETWYLPDIESRLAKTSLANYASTWRKCIEPTWGDSFVTEVKPLRIQGWLLTMTKAKAEQAANVLSSILEFPVRYELLDRNPMRVKYRMPTAVQKRDKTVYTLAQAVDVMKACRGSYIESAVICALFGSCRPGESLSPMCPELHRAETSTGAVAAAFDLVRQIDHDGNVYDGMKTKASARPIVFVGSVAERMLEIKAEREAAGEIWLADNGLGDVISQQSLNAGWKRLCAESGIPSIPFRNLRNSWRTYMSWELHIDESKLEKMMGHTGRSVTEKHYNRPNAEMFIDALSDAWSEFGVERKFFSA